jgi:hypothetical protein
VFVAIVDIHIDSVVSWLYDRRQNYPTDINNCNKTKDHTTNATQNQARIQTHAAQATTQNSNEFTPRHITNTNFE